jgi:REP element-mobilizing transposase RayT
MAHSFIANRIHVIFSTKDRRNLIPPEIEQRLWRFMSSVAQERKIQVLAIGGIENHIHALIAPPADMAIAKAVQSIKGVSSKWMNDEFFPNREFGWQQGYAAFGVSHSLIPKTVEYIQHQREHHTKRKFEDEILEFLERNGVEFNKDDVFG